MESPKPNSRSFIHKDGLTDNQYIAIAMQPLIHSHYCVIYRMLDGALPDDSYTPAKGVKSLDMTPVAFNIAQEFLSPELLVGLGSGCVSAAFVPVPKASVNKHNCTVLWKHKIRGARQFLHMKSISKSSGEKTGTESSFRLSILPTDTRHHSTALRSCRNWHGFEYVSLVNQKGINFARLQYFLDVEGSTQNEAKEHNMQHIPRKIRAGDV